jgi:cyclophilin family peptidyl-prolyl cis-trans isomerase
MKPVLLMSICAAALLTLACATAAPTTTPTPVRPPAAAPAARPTATSGTPGPTQPPRTVPGPQGTSYKQWARPPLTTINPASKYTATLQTNKGKITIELFAAEAPRTVNNFVFLAREGFYDGVTFHRVIKDFMVQSGDPRGDGTGGPGYRFADEPVTRKYAPGIVAMANAGPNTNGSQFFIVHGASVALPPNYVIFGQVVEGMDTVDRLANTPVRAGSGGEPSTPTERLVIERVEISEKPGQ